MESQKAQNNKIKNPIYVIGTDSSGPEGLPLFLQKLIFSSNKLAAPRRILEVLPKWWINSTNKRPLPEVFASDNPIELAAWLKIQNEQTIVLASGDPLWFGIGRFLIESLPQNRLIFHPHTSSLQLAFARLGRPWQDASWISLHGRDPDPLATRLQQRPKALAILTDPSRGGAEEVKQYLRASGLEKNYALWVCERLGHPKEHIQRVLPTEEIAADLHPLHMVVLIEENAPEPEAQNLPLFGIEDGIFLQNLDRPGLMTKREIRIQLLADLELPANGVIWDVGAGVGSVGLEALRLRPNLRLMAIEKRIGASSLIEANAKRLCVNPSEIIEAEAITVLTNMDFPKELHHPNRVILGGGGSDRNNLLKLIIKKLTPGGIVVTPLATLEATSELISIMKESSLRLNISQHQAYRGVPLSKGTRLNPTNPVFILKGKAS